MVLKDNGVESFSQEQSHHSTHFHHGKSLITRENHGAMNTHRTHGELWQFMDISFTIVRHTVELLATYETFLDTVHTWYISVFCEKVMHHSQVHGAPELSLDILKMESWTHMGCTANIIIKDVIYVFASISKIMRILLMGWRNRERWAPLGATGPG